MPRVGIELAGRFVCEEQARPVGEGPGEGDPLLLAAGQLVRPVAGSLAQADELEQVGDACVACLGIGMDKTKRYLDVLGGSQEWHQPEGLEDKGDGLAADADELVLGHS